MKPNVNPVAQATWHVYGCVRCNVVHYEDSPLYKPHLMYQTKTGIRTVSAEERGQHLVATDQSTEEPPEQDIRNALQLLAVTEPHETERHACPCRVVPEKNIEAARARLQSAVAKLERMARHARP